MARSSANQPSFIALLSLLFVIITVATLGGNVVVARSLVNDNDETSFYKECTSNFDCPTNYCCTVGMMRFTLPFCSPMGIQHDPCRPDNEKQNLTLSFPKFEMHVIESYLLLCPCKDGLQCSRSTASCSPEEMMPV